MSNNDSIFWKLLKEVAGLDVSKSSAVLDVDALASHFATKTSNGAVQPADYYVPRDPARKSLRSFRIRYKRTLKCLKKIDASKASNGISNSFLRECADVIAPAVDNLFTFIVRRGEYPSDWKIGAVTPVHKRGAVKEEANYQPISVLDNLSSVFEGVVSPQLSKWVANFTPDCQFGFTAEYGCDDYGAALSFTITECLERRGEGILITTDVKGAFDKSWWAMLKTKFKARGMSGSALKLMKSYLYKRFLKVIANGKASELKQIFSSVPQGGKWSTDLWNFDVNEIDTAISDDGSLYCYANDNAVWYEVIEENRRFILQVINTDLQALANWAQYNKTTFEHAKNYAQVFSRRSNPIDPYGMISFEGHEVEVVSVQKVVGYTLDSKLTWGNKVDSIAVKARKRMAASVRLKPMLDKENMKTMYTMFLRSIMEYESIAWMGAADSHLSKLDRIQAAAERVGGFTVESLASRRSAAAVAFALKLMDGKARGVLKDFIPALVKKDVPNAVHGSVRSNCYGLLMPDYVDKVKGFHSLDVFKRGFWGTLPRVWSTLPQKLVVAGKARGWLKIKKKCVRFITLGEKPKMKLPRSANHALISKAHSIKLNNELNAQAPVFVPNSSQCAKSTLIVNLIKLGN